MPTEKEKTRHAMTLWTDWEDYYATGEGRRLMTVIGYAAAEDGCRRMFAHVFDAS